MRRAAGSGGRLGRATQRLASGRNVCGQRDGDTSIRVARVCNHIPSNRPAVVAMSSALRRCSRARQPQPNDGRRHRQLGLPACGRRSAPTSRYDSSQGQRRMCRYRHYAGAAGIQQSWPTAAICSRRPQT